MPLFKILLRVKEIMTVSTMWLKHIVKIGRAVFISSYTNFNVIASLHIAQYFATSTQNVYALYEVDLPPSALNILNDDMAKSICIVRSFNDIKLVQSKSILIAIIDTIDASLFNTIINKAYDFYIFTQKFSRPKGRRDYHIYKVYKVKEGLFLVHTDTNQRYLLKISGDNLEEVGIPDEVMRLYNELKEFITTFGSVKASDFVKYCLRKYGYSREACLELLRQAISLKLIKYVDGYIFPS